MSHTTMRDFLKELSRLLDAAYLEYDKITLSRAGHIEHFIIRERLNTLKELAKLAGIGHIERRRCGNRTCGTLLERTSTYKYCSNACKQKAYRIRHGQFCALPSSTRSPVACNEAEKALPGLQNPVAP